MTNQRAKYTSAHVANYILRYFHNNNITITPLKLQKLIYIAYAWYLVLSEKQDRLFDEPIQAWRLGPVVPSIYYYFRGKSEISKDFYVATLDNEEGKDMVEIIPIVPKVDTQTRSILGAVLHEYKDYSAYDLVNILHSPNSPWHKKYSSEGDKILDDEDIKKAAKAKIDEVVKKLKEKL
ncbi:MAG: DUF4065 domain-containing protein [Alphaproteobacteria bacterium]|nr:DUF4065 domain-containing protein [Alphaproteobacteria bacterium]